MRKIFMVLILAFFALSPVFANAAFIDQGSPAPKTAPGFAGPISGSMADSVASAKNLEDGAPVALIGNIVSQLAGSKNKFVFKDQSGEITIKLGKKVFGKQTVTPDDNVLISGEVDRDYGDSVKIDVILLKVLR
ncbi:MAG: NirD/YgiW/YdeI family stress tolerance protein [Desulfovibrio sp.]|nr:NirD/YgiW/YdeI family stress tolerance protein [Desulfovibrio sp.]